MELAYFDRTARGRLIVTGRDRKDLIHRLATNSILGLEKGQGASTAFCTAKGRMIDWSVVLDRGDDLLLLTGNPERLSGHIQQFTITEDVTVRNYMAIELIVCGPGAAGVLGVELQPWHFADVRLADVQVQVVRIEPLMGDAYVVLAPDAVTLRRELSRHGRALSVEEVERLRVESGIPTAPNEINEDHNPWEARLGHAVSLQKGCYIGQEVIARLDTYDKVQRRLAGFRLDRPFEAGDRILADGEPVAELTTVADEIALGYAEVGHEKPGTALEGATVVELPMRRWESAPHD